MSNKNKFESLLIKNGYSLGLYEMTRSVFGTFYSGALVNIHNKIEYDFKGVGFDEAYSDIVEFLNTK